MANLLNSLLGINRTTVVPTERAGVNGTRVYGGYIDNNEKNATLAGQQRYLTYQEMLVNTSIVSAGVRYFLNMITKSAWKVEPASDTPEAREAAEFMESLLYDMNTPWHRIVRKGVTFKFYGFGVQEWIAKQRPDGKIGLMDIEARPQKTITKWDVDEWGLVHGMIQESPQTMKELYLPRKKVIYIVDDSLVDSPEGLGLFRHLVSPAKRLQRYEELEGYGYETDLRGIPIGRAPFAELARLVEEGLITDAQRVAIEAPLKSFMENHIKGPKLGLLLDSSVYQSQNEAATPSQTKLWDVDLLKCDSDNLQQVSGAISRVNGELARILGVEGLLLGQGKGSQALSRDKSDNFYMVVDAALTELADCYSADIINTVWELNGFDPKLKPWFKTDSIQLRDIEQITGALKDMAQAGGVLSPDDPAIGEVRDLLGLSRGNPLQIMETLLDKEVDNKDPKE